VRLFGPVESEEIDDTVHEVRLKQLRVEITEVMARRRSDDPKKRISTSVAMDLVNEIETEIADLTYQSRALTAEKIRRQEDVPAVLKEWNSYTLDMKRERLKRDIVAVIVNPTGRGVRFRAENIEISWRQEASLRSSVSTSCRPHSRKVSCRHRSDRCGYFANSRSIHSCTVIRQL
jgi:hypothetical protein